MKRTMLLAVALCGLMVAHAARAQTVGYWRFEDGAAGTNATTLATEANSPTLDGTAHPTTAPKPSFSADVPGVGRLEGATNSTSLSFPQISAGNDPGAGVFVAYSTDDPLLQQNSFTVEAFIKTTMTSPTYPAIVEKVRGPGGNTWSLGLSGGFAAFTRFDATGGGNQTTSGGPSLNDGDWHHVALTYEYDSGTGNGTATMYADYNQAATRTVYGALQHQYGLDIAGGAGGHRGYIGLIDEVRFTDTALTPGQFLHLRAMPVVENSSRKMAAGDLDGNGIMDLAIIRASGELDLQLYGPGGAIVDKKAVPGITASAVTVADLDGDNVAEVVFVNAATKQLQSYKPADGTLTHWGSPTGTGVALVSAGDCDGDSRHELMVNRGDSTAVYVLQPETGVYTYANSSMARFTSGELIAGNSGVDFVGRDGVIGGNGIVHLYDYDTNTWTSLGGGAYDEAVPGNYFINDDLDEVMTGWNMNMWNEPYGFKYTTGAAGHIAPGNTNPNLGGQELWYCINNRIYESRSVWTEASPGGYQSLNVPDNVGWGDLILADIDGDGLDELIARKDSTAFDGIIYVWNYGDAAFEAQTLVPEPASALLLLGGLGALLRRRRSR